MTRVTFDKIVSGKSNVIP